MSEDHAVEPPKPVQAPRAGVVRQTVEFLVVLSLGILLFRTFTAEAYIVPTGSMAPTLLGMHQEVDCPNCHMRFALGLDEEGNAGRPICPNCGQTDLLGAPVVPCSGDRLLVQKGLYDFRRPRRWEVAVFHFPGDPTQAYVKRVVGLPGEAVQIVGGDIRINGRIARKTLQEQRAMRILVYDNQFVPGDAKRYPRFVHYRGRNRGEPPSDWTIEGSRFVHAATDAESGSIDWIEYRHWDPDRARYTPVYDFNPYNGAELRGENRVSDLMIEARLEVGEDVPSVEVRLASGADRFIVSLPFGETRPPEVRRNGRLIALDHPLPSLPAPADPAKPRLLEASIMDRRLTVAVDGILLFDPVDYDEPALAYRPDAAGPIAIGVARGSLAVDGFKVYRDVFYTSALANTPRRPFGVDAPYKLGPDEFFVLGDNSQVSNDSRFWTPSPIVPGSLFLGKPFLVHLPGQVVPLKVFGRSFYWVPDPREIRYIR